jgi:ATP-dependent DNA helicase
LTGKFKFNKPAVRLAQRKKLRPKWRLLSFGLKERRSIIDVVPNTKEGKQGVLSDADLDVLLDRRPEVFSERQKGWISGAGGVAQDGMDQDVSDIDHTGVGAGKKATFAVYEVPVEEGNDSLSKMLGEEKG